MLQISSAATCVPADYICEKRLFGAYEKSGLNPYDIRYPCDDLAGRCYKDLDYIDDFLDLNVKVAVDTSTLIFIPLVTLMHLINLLRPVMK